VLQTDDEPQHDSLRDWPYPYIACNERFFYTPTVKKSVLANCVALSRGRLIIPTVPFVGVFEPGNFGSLGPSQRHFGAPQHSFGSPGNFSFQTKFGSLGPFDRHFGPIERNFGSSGRSSGKH
jgi:hypothetical protein